MHVRLREVELERLRGGADLLADPREELAVAGIGGEILAVGRQIHLERFADLGQVVPTLRAPSALPGGDDGRNQHPHEHRQNSDHHKHLNERKCQSSIHQARLRIRKCVSARNLSFTQSVPLTTAYVK